MSFLRRQESKLNFVWIPAFAGNRRFKDSKKIKKGVNDKTIDFSIKTVIENSTNYIFITWNQSRQ